MSNPRFVQVTEDDKMWFFECDRSAFSSVEANAADWLNENIFEKDGSCGRIKDHFRLFPGKLDRTDEQMQLTGVCGTNVLICSGFRDTPLELFFSWRAAEAASAAITPKEWSDFVASIPASGDIAPNDSGGDANGPTPAGFWDTFDEKLLAAVPDVILDFFFFRKEKLIYVHFEFGLGRDLVNRYFDSIDHDQRKFMEWLISIGPIPRRVWEIDDNGNRINISDKLPFKNIKFQLPDSVPLAVYRDETNDCAFPCLYKSCSILVGSLTEFDTDNGVANVDLEVVLSKGYCADANGDPCG